MTVHTVLGRASLWVPFALCDFVTVPMHNCGENMVKTWSVTRPAEQMHQNLTMPDINDQHTRIRLLLGHIFYNLWEYKYTSEWRKCFCQKTHLPQTLSISILPFSSLLCHIFKTREWCRQMTQVSACLCAFLYCSAGRLSTHMMPVTQCDTS